MELALPTSPAQTTTTTYYNFKGAEEVIGEQNEEDAEQLPKKPTHQSNLIATMATLQSALSTSRDAQLNCLRTLSANTTSPSTPPPSTTSSTTTSLEPLQMPTFVPYNGSKIESAKENTPLNGEDASSQNVDLVPCYVCKRTFNPVTLGKHIVICQRMSSKRRKVFDSFRQRREGTDLASYPLPKSYGLPPQPNLFKTERSQSPHQAEIAAVSPVATRKKTLSSSQAANNDELVRSTARASMRSKSLSSNPNNTPIALSETNLQRERLRSSERINAKRSVQPQSEKCPHCERFFGIKAYDRHVEWCKEKALQASIKQTSSKTEQNAAMERLQARTKYRAPCLKTKRSINRDKYSGMNNEENDAIESNKFGTTNKNDISNNSIMTQSMTSSMTSERIKYEETSYNYSEEQVNKTKKQENSHVEGEFMSMLNIKKYMPKLKHNHTLAKIPQTHNDEDLQETINKSSRQTAGQQQLTVSNCVWINPDGSADPNVTPLGIQPRRNCRNKTKFGAKAVQSECIVAEKVTKNWQHLFVEPEARTSTPRAIHSTASSPAIKSPIKRLPEPTNMSSAVVTGVVAAVKRPKRKLPVLQSNKPLVNEPMKATIPLNKQFYGQLRNMTATEIDIELNCNMEIIKAATNNQQDANSLQTSKHLLRSRSFTLSSDKYDPFLSAKRQLEELCSPTNTADQTCMSVIKSSACTSTPTTPLPQNKSMTTSLILGTALPNSNPRALHNNKTTAVNTHNNFRRTSSLRGPRRSPMLSTRPLFVQNYRPTIQRGLSDEGPISTNFLKPEEYDEMPVRSVCVNDFALTKSPRVIRRDLSATANRKPHLKLNLQSASTTSTAAVRSMEKNLQADVKELSKTDSLAVFLKYEHELEQLANKQTSQVDSTVVAKELKDKSNNALSKQQDAQTEKKLLLAPLDAVKHAEHIIYNNNDNKINNTPRYETLNDKKLPAINLNAILNAEQQQQQTENVYKLATSTENIDPKLINKCDNLPLSRKFNANNDKNTINNKTTTQIQIQQQQQQHNTAGNVLKRKMRLGRNQFLYDASPDDKLDAAIAAKTITPAVEYKQAAMPVFDDLDFDFEEFLSTFEQDEEEFPLFKDCREFLTNRATNKQLANKSLTTASSALFPQLKPLYFDTNSARPKTAANAAAEDAALKMANETHKREIFISIETEQSDSGQSPISPNSLRSMVGNAQTVVEVDEVASSNDTKFTKITDDDDDDDDDADVVISNQPINLPNVQLNNAKNLMQRMHNQFFQRNENAAEQETKQQTRVTDADEDSDYANRVNICNNSRASRRICSAKTNSDSAYGSLSRQRSTDLPVPLPRAMSNTRPATANLPMPSMQTIQQQQQQQQQQFYKTKANKTRSNQCVYKGSSSGSGSDTSLPPIDLPKTFNLMPVTNTNNNNNNDQNYTKSYESQQSTQTFAINYGKKTMSSGSRIRRSSRSNETNNNKSNNNNNNNNTNPNNNNNNNSNNNNDMNESQVAMTMMLSSASNLRMESPMSSSTSSNPSMTSSACKRMSKFCHECGSKFIVEQAKFCMECGIKRITL